MQLHNSTLNSINAYTDKFEYYNNNKDRIKDYSKDYYINNKNKINKQKKQKNNCECAGTYTDTNKIRHIRSIKHQQFLCQPIN